MRLPIQIKYSFIIYLLSVVKLNGRCYSITGQKRKMRRKSTDEEAEEKSEIAGPAQPEAGGAGVGNHGAAFAGKAYRRDPEMASDREKHFDRLFKPL